MTSGEQQPTQSETVTEQQPTQSETVTEQQPTQSETVTGTQQEHAPSQFSSDDSEELPNPFPTSSKTFKTKDPKSIPKYSLRPKLLLRLFLPELIYYTCFLFTDPEKKNKIQMRELLPLSICTWCQMHQNFFDFTIYQHYLLF